MHSCIAGAVVAVKAGNRNMYMACPAGTLCPLQRWVPTPDDMSASDVATSNPQAQQPHRRPRMETLMTPDGRYLIVRGRLWRATNPDLDEQRRDELVHALMDARRAVKAAKASADGEALAAARQAVNTAKVGLGERGPVWWTDGSPDLNRRMISNTPYADWFNRASA